MVEFEMTSPGRVLRCDTFGVVARQGTPSDNWWWWRRWR